MDGWIKWLGEFVWRLSKWPDGVKGDEREENFWYRTYGVGSLICALVIGLWLVAKMGEPISKLVAFATTYTGADKPLTQGYIGVFLALAVGVPIVICGVFLLATAILFVWFLVIVVTKGLGMAIGWVVAKYLERQSKETQVALAGAAAGALLGWLAALYLTRSRAKAEVAATKEHESAPRPPVKSLEVTPVPPEVLKLP